MLFNNAYDEQLEELLLVEDEVEVGKKAQIIVYNDDYNTFDWVIECFVKILRHTAEQAEQCSLLIHFKGKASVKTASKNVLKPLKDALVDKGLSAVIEEFED